MEKCVKLRLIAALLNLFLRKSAYFFAKNAPKVYDNISSYGGALQMDAGVITANHALNRGGGIYLGSGEVDDAPAARFFMENGAIYFNEAGTADNAPYNIDPNGAGAEIYTEGKNAELTVRTAEEITAYIQDTANRFVPEKDRNVWFMDWYEDFNATRSEKTRYMLTRVLDRVVYTPVLEDNANQALILDRSTELKVTKTEIGDAPADAEYSFELQFTNLPPVDEALPVVFTDANGEITEKEITPEGGVFNFTLKNGESFKVSGLPAGAKFILTETDHGLAERMDANFTNVEEGVLNGWSVSGNTRTVWQESAEATKLSVVEIVNDYTPETTPPTTEPPTTEPPATEPPTTVPPTPPKTGDNSNSALWVSLALLSLTAATVPLVYMRKRKEQNK